MGVVGEQVESEPYCPSLLLQPATVKSSCFFSVKWKSAPPQTESQIKLNDVGLLVPLALCRAHWREHRDFCCCYRYTNLLLHLCFLIAMEPITQDKRVSQGHNGDLYFSNVMVQDMQTDYSCNARFHFTHTIQQKNPFTLKVLTSKCRPLPGAGGRGQQPTQPEQPRVPGAGGDSSPRLT